MKAHKLAPRVLVSLLVLMSAATTVPYAQQQSARAHAVKGATVEGITEYTLPNGLKFLLFPDPSKPTATVNITYLTGSRMEGYGETGMAHLFEHMLFKGSTHHPNIPQELTEHGSRPNGSTWVDRTNYFETFSATDTNLDWALDLESDRMVNSFLKAEDLQSEFTVVRNEFEMGENSPLNVLMERLLSTAYLWHGYGRSTIGARSDIENVPIERLRAWYRKYYQPDNAVLVVSGKFDEAKAISLIEQKFGAIPKPDRSGANVIYPTYTREPTQDGERSVTLRRVGDLQEVMVGYHIPSGAHPDAAAMDVLSNVLTDEPSGRLYKALVETKKAARVSSWSFQFAEPGMLLAWAEVRKENDVAPAREALISTIETLPQNPPTAEEVDRAKTALLKQHELNMNNPELIALLLSESAAMGDWRLMFLHRDRLRAVTPQSALRVATAYLKPSNRTLGLFVPTEKPERAEIGEAPPIASMVANYRGDTAKVVGEAFDPSPNNINARTVVTALPNGMKLVLLPKKTRGGQVALSYAMRFGNQQTLKGKRIAADLAGDMLMRGTAKLSRQAVKDTLDKLQARGTVSGSPTQVYAMMQTVRATLPDVIRIVAQILRTPAFDPKEFEEDRQERLASLEEEKSEPMAIANRIWTRLLNPLPKDDPNYTTTVDEQMAELKSVTVDDARKFHKDFYGPTSSELSIVGDFDQAEIERVVRDVFGDWKSPQPFQRIARPFVEVKADNVQLETPDKANAAFFAGENLKIRDTSPDYPALVMANYMIGGGFLNSRLATRIRQKEGLSYGVGSFVGAGALDDRGTFGAYAIYAPENVARLEAAFMEEIKKVIDSGFTQAELDAARTGYLQSRQVSRSQDQQLAGQLGNYAYLNRTMKYDADLEAQIQKLTLDQVNVAARKYIDPTRLVIVKAGDFANKKPKT